MTVESAWLDGFWEVDVHRALLQRGESLAMADRAIVTFEGGVGLGSMLAQRFRHGRLYGIGRSAGLGAAARLARVAAAPMVPPLLCSRIARALRDRGMSPLPWLPSLPSLALLATAWAIGEGVGTMDPASDGGARPARPALPMSTNPGDKRSNVALMGEAG